MEIELRGKKWNQITKEEYINGKRRDHFAIFNDEYYGEKTYFMEVFDAPLVEEEA